MFYQSRAPDLQLAPHLPARWRSDPALAVVVLCWTRTEPYDLHNDRICGRGGVDCGRGSHARMVDRHHVSFYPAQLLAWFVAGAFAGASCQTASARGVRLPNLPTTSHPRHFLALWLLPETFRHIRDPRSLSSLWLSTPDDSLP